MHTNAHTLLKSKPIPNWEAHVRRLVEGLGEGEVLLDVVDHQVTNIEIEEITCLFKQSTLAASANNEDAVTGTLTDLPQKPKS